MQKYEIGERVRHQATKKVGTVTEFDGDFNEVWVDWGRGDVVIYDMETEYVLQRLS